jgi:pimeloyl-ACP methyl ester carboxylesterase
MQNEIFEFRIQTPQPQLDDLVDRLSRSRFPESETVQDWSQGIPLKLVKDLAEYWQTDYDWRVCEDSLNSYPQFKTKLNDLDIHFLHIRSPEENARPLIMTHGWPGSVIEFLEVIDPLTNPVAHGGKAEDAFHLVIPSLPGYGFSEKPNTVGWSVEKIAETWDELMLRLGYPRYFAQGGDWGSMVTSAIGHQNKGHCAGIHLNLVVVGAPDKSIIATLTEEEKRSMKVFADYMKNGQGYAAIQGTRPQTIGYGLADSPVGQLAWIVEKFGEWSGGSDLLNLFDRDRLLDNVTLYWLTNTAASSARLYWHSFVNPEVPEVLIPTACSLFKDEILQPSRRWAEQRYKQISYWNYPEKGGHFAAMEQSDIFVNEVRDGFANMQL